MHNYAVACCAGLLYCSWLDLSVCNHRSNNTIATYFWRQKIMVYWYILSGMARWNCSSLVVIVWHNAWDVFRDTRCMYTYYTSHVFTLSSRVNYYIMLSSIMNRFIVISNRNCLFKTTSWGYHDSWVRNCGYSTWLSLTLIIYNYFFSSTKYNCFNNKRKFKYWSSGWWYHWRSPWMCRYISLSGGCCGGGGS